VTSSFISLGYCLLFFIHITSNTTLIKRKLHEENVLWQNTGGYIDCVVDNYQCAVWLILQVAQILIAEKIHAIATQYQENAERADGQVNITVSLRATRPRILKKIKKQHNSIIAIV